MTNCSISSPLTFLRPKLQTKIPFPDGLLARFTTMGENEILFSDMSDLPSVHDDTGTLKTQENIKFTASVTISAHLNGTESGLKQVLNYQFA